ncbi:sulfatase [Maribacter sp. TH_r10]|uniref:Sulfatase-like hydrolase/transferase n=1 Tax=Maribacter luteus TaxID=2594478 RepID=A0A6I2MPQ7_9FLAO|nr:MULTISPECIES: sulfatase [Maribacter]MDV7139091.1 sulfatase [Maribacter sp. TH_r10]MRX64797.1 sulfatase-like hydrolase/transferase [Maribacter luteus]
MKRLIILVLIVLLNSSCNSEQESIVPNIIIINIDDMGWKDVGFMGSEYYETPNIDYLSSLGMVFTNGYASASNCAPSRACLMTGQWTPRHGIYTVSPSDRGKSENRKLIPTKNTHTLSPKHKVLPQVLQENGYLTCHAGKWHLSNDPLKYGFNVNIGGGHNGLPKSYYPPYKNITIDGSPDKYLTDAIMEKAIQFVDTVQKPFYLNYSPYAVHVPIMAVDSIVPKYEQKESWKGQGNAKYASMVDNLDRNIGMLIHKLKERDLFDNTLIVFTSDNGGLYGITKQKPLRAGKGSYYEGGIREPFFFVLNNKISSNTKSDIPITNLDIFPTVLNYAGIDTNSLSLDGNNLSSILEEEVQTMERSLFWHFPIYLEAYNVNDNENRDSLFRTRPGSVIRKGDWKLHYYFEDNGEELYNLANDIGERNNLAETYPEKVEELIKLLEKWWEETNAPVPATKNPEYINKYNKS